MSDKDAAKRADDEKKSISEAIKFWLRAKDEGLGSGAQASLTAQRRIKMYSLTCVIADNTSNVLHNPLTDIRIQQRALNSLGYYQGPYDGQLSVATRIAIRRFQNAMAWVDSGELSSRQIVYLICNGAETARDSASSTRLALMYAAGVGVQQLHSYALGFFKQAEPRDLDAKYFLAVLSGTGRCGFPINYDRADQRLKESAAQNHLYAHYLNTHYPPLLDQGARWRMIGNDPEYRKSLKMLDKDCPLPPPPPRPAAAVSPVQLAPPAPPPP
ncbi:MAG: peptidoglycan-binding protein [Micropepsaceae bacterium]